jgi:signal transduction histidine kinase
VHRVAVSMKSAWDGRRLDLEKAGAPLGIANRDGELVGSTALALEMFRSAGWSPGELPARLPDDLWGELERQPEGQAVEWGQGDQAGNLGVSRYPVEDAHWLLSMRDLSVRKQTLAHQIYQSTQHEFSRLIAAAAHDLRSPLSSMAFNVGVLRRRFRELPSEETERLLEEIKACCEWQDRAITGLVESSKVAEIVEVRLDSLFGRLEQLLRPMFRERAGKLEIDLPAQAAVRGSALTLEHIFLNLISNALQSTTRSVAITISIGGQSKGLLRILVADDGPGVPPELRGRVFDPFVSTKLNGTGIGLCLAREAARSLGGDLRLVPNPENGACFEVLLEDASKEGSA